MSGPSGHDPTHVFRDVLPLPGQDDTTVDRPPLRLDPAGPRTPPGNVRADVPRVTSPDSETVDGPPPPAAPPAPAPGSADETPTAALGSGPAGPLLTAPFPGVLPMPRADEQPPPARDAALEEGASVGGCVIERRLAQRPTADVFLARHPQHGECVLQVLTPAMATTFAGRGFLLDARARVALDDPRLARVLAVGDAPRPWVALERLRGPTLRQTIDRGPLPVLEAARIARELARGLARAHARRIVHGDLTPRDVRLEGDRGAVKLTGFGVPKAIGPTGTRHAYAGGPALGDAAYAAPELFAGEAPGPAADVWAIGVILHEMLAGRAPFQGSAREVMEAVLRGAPPTLEGARPDVPPGLATVVRRCLSRSAAERYPTAQELAEALHQVVPDVPTRRPARPERSRAALALAVVLALLALAGAVALALR